LSSGSFAVQFSFNGAILNHVHTAALETAFCELPKTASDGACEIVVNRLCATGLGDSIESKVSCLDQRHLSINVFDAIAFEWNRKRLQLKSVPF
jgi:hypothetical protein